jgi:WD40 repeat protein
VVFNLKTEAVVSRIDATEAISPLLFSPDGTFLVAGMTGQGGTGVQTFRVVDSGLVALVETLDSVGLLDSAGDVILSASFNREGRYLAVFASPSWEYSTADSMGEVFLYDVSTWSLLWHVALDSSFSGTTTDRDTFRVSDGTDIAWAPDDEHVICGGDNGTLFVLRARDGSLRRRVALPIEHRIVTFAIDDDRRLLWTAKCDSLLKLALDEIVA